MTRRPAERRRGVAGPRVRAAAAVLAGLAALPGCRTDEGSVPLHVAADWTQPPTTDAGAVASLTLTSGTGQPVSGAHLQAQGFMSHPGMPPAVAAVDEVGGGVYRARFHFTMAGDWLIRVTGTTTDGRTIDQQLELTRVGVAPVR